MGGGKKRETRCYNVNQISWQCQWSTVRVDTVVTRHEHSLKCVNLFSVVLNYGPS